MYYFLNFYKWSFILQQWKSILNELRFIEMDLDDDLGEDGLSRDGIDDFLEENYRRTAEREADHNFIKDNFSHNKYR